jgi:hypothetical protein
VVARGAWRGKSPDGAKARRVSKPPLVIITALALAACSRGATGVGTQPAPSPSLPIVTGHYPAYGSAPDLTWIAGRLERSWLLRTSPSGECTYVIYSTRRDAPWGGRIALYGDVDAVSRFPDGDMVVVTAGPVTMSSGPCGDPGVTVTAIAEH